MSVEQTTKIAGVPLFDPKKYISHVNQSKGAQLALDQAKVR